MTTATCSAPCVIKPSSRGTVKLRTPMADSKPLVRCNFLTTDDDRPSVIDGVRIALEIASQPALQAVERGPFSVPASDSDADIIALGRALRARPSTTRRRRVPSAPSSTQSYAFTGRRGCASSTPR